MTSFEAGFFNYISECGLSHKQASYILKRAMDHPAAQEMFKDLNEEGEEDPGNLDVLSNMTQQDRVDQEMSEISKKLNQ